MSGGDVTPEVRDAIVRFAAAEFVLLAVGVALYFAFSSIWPIIVAAVLSAGIGLFLVLQARPSHDK